MSTRRRMFLLSCVLSSIVATNLWAADDIEIWAHRVTETWFERTADGDNHPQPKWTEVPAILGKPDGSFAQLVINDGLNDYGSVTVDLGVEVGPGQLVIHHWQRGPGNSKKTLVSGSARSENFRNLGSMGSRPEPQVALISFVQPIRYVKLHSGAGGGVGVGDDSTWAFDAVGVRCRLLEPAKRATSALEAIQEPSQDALAEIYQQAKREGRELLAELERYQMLLRENSEAALPQLAARMQTLDRQLDRVQQGLVQLQACELMRLFAGDGPPAYCLTWESPLRKIRGDALYVPLNPTLTGKVTLARGEYEALQLVMMPGEQDLKQVSISWSDLKEERSGARLPKEHIEAFRVGYVSSKGSEWPDPLFPLTAFDVTQGKPQPIWFRVYAPEATEPGNYVGKIRVKVSHAYDVEATLRVQVCNFSLPRTGRMKTVLGWGVSPEQRYEMLQHRHNPGGGAGVGAVTDAKYTLSADGELRIDFSEYDKALADSIAKGLNCFGLPYNCGDSNGINPGRMTKRAIEERTGEQVRISLNPLDGPEARARLIQWARDFCDHLKEKGWFQYSFLYIWDEPLPQQHDQILAIGRVFREAVPDLKIMVVQAIHPKLYEVTDIFTATALNFAGSRERIQHAQQAGKELWWYTAGDPYPCSTYAIPHEAASPRLMYWLNWKLGVAGNLYWAATNYHQPSDGGQGNGMLFYPSENPGQPIGSIRLEMIRDGIEDYEAFCLLDDATGGKSELLSIPNTIVRDAQTYTEDPAVIEGYREKLYTHLSRLQQPERE